MAQGINVLAAKPGTHVVEGKKKKTDSHKWSSDPHTQTVTCVHIPPTLMCTQKNKYNIIKL